MQLRSATEGLVWGAHAFRVFCAKPGVKLPREKLTLSISVSGFASHVSAPSPSAYSCVCVVSARGDPTGSIPLLAEEAPVTEPTATAGVGAPETRGVWQAGRCPQSESAPPVPRQRGRSSFPLGPSLLLLSCDLSLLAKIHISASSVFTKYMVLWLSLRTKSYNAVAFYLRASVATSDTSVHLQSSRCPAQAARTDRERCAPQGPWPPGRVAGGASGRQGMKPEPGSWSEDRHALSRTRQSCSPFATCWTGAWVAPGAESVSTLRPSCAGRSRHRLLHTRAHSRVGAPASRQGSCVLGRNGSTRFSGGLHGSRHTLLLRVFCT